MMVDQNPEMNTQCLATTKSGKPCRNKPLAGSAYCRIHQPEKPEPVLELPAAAESELSEGELRLQLAEELEQLVERLQQTAPHYQPPPFSLHNLRQRLDSNLTRLAPSADIFERLRGSALGDLFDLDTWKGAWYMINYTLEYQTDLIKRRLSGDYETDEWGLDLEYLNTIRPFFEFLYKTYWRVQTRGIENIPEAGRALLVANHSGQLPWDGSMLVISVLTEHPNQRLVRTLIDSWESSVPFVSSMLTRCGQVQGTEENGLRLLEQEELVAIFPEGYKGLGKPYRDRYQLARFGRSGYIRLALRTQAPIIPVAIVGAEETNLTLARSTHLARLFGVPYFPISPTFPWLGPLGFIPLPTKWSIEFGESLPTDLYGPDAADDPRLVSELSDQVRSLIRQMISLRLAQRRSIFYG